MESIVVEMKLKEVKEWSVRYDEITPNAAISSLYIRKSAMPASSYPNKLTVTISE